MVPDLGKRFDVKPELELFDRVAEALMQYPVDGVDESLDMPPPVEKCAVLPLPPAYARLVRPYLYPSQDMAKMSNVSLGESFQACLHALDRALVTAACFVSSFDRIMGSSSSGRSPNGSPDFLLELPRVGLRRPTAPEGSARAAPGAVSSSQSRTVTPWPDALRWQTKLGLQRQLMRTVATPSPRASSEIRPGRRLRWFPIKSFRQPLTEDPRPRMVDTILTKQLPLFILPRSSRCQFTREEMYTGPYMIFLSERNDPYSFVF